MNRFEIFDHAPKSDLASFFNRIETDSVLLCTNKRKTPLGVATIPMDLWHH